jgi:hypothetical protein
LLHFFLVKKSDFRSSFFALEKSNQTKKLAADDGKLLLIKKIKMCTFVPLKIDYDYPKNPRRN